MRWTITGTEPLLQLRCIELNGDWSGFMHGLSEQTTALGAPCLTLRENTERPITIEAGSNRLVRRRSRKLPEKGWQQRLRRLSSYPSGTKSIA